jgi:hypothetical protein
MNQTKGQKERKAALPTFFGKNWEKKLRNYFIHCPASQKEEEKGLFDFSKILRNVPTVFGRGCQMVGKVYLYRKVTPCPLFTFWIFAQNMMTSSNYRFLKLPCHEEYSSCNLKNAFFITILLKIVKIQHEIDHLNILFVLFT